RAFIVDALTLFFGQVDVYLPGRLFEPAFFIYSPRVPMQYRMPERCLVVPPTGFAHVSMQDSAVLYYDTAYERVLAHTDTPLEAWESSEISAALEAWVRKYMNKDIKFEFRPYGI